MNEKAKPLQRVSGFDLYNLFEGPEGMTDPSALVTLWCGYADALNTFQKSQGDLLILLLKSWQMFASANLYESRYGRNLGRFGSMAASFAEIAKSIPELLPGDLIGADAVAFASDKDMDMYVESKYPYLFRGAAMAGGLAPQESA
ncbi:MAG: hypothetical protein COV46_06540 [Deltaproteobacteria bacterium CG11_big_fil_rev_8_21_14_0_20_49_13]|nr:MAG: hypothetical protein COV46_06540 [Deltaproteobacteria bacterium CG11_big_fil_rev_8_21_14_0_20_49_13]